MRWLLFLSRLAFVTGVFFLLTVSLQISNWSQHEAITGTIVIIGYFLSIFIIPAVNLSYLAVLVIRKNLNPVPLWLSLANLLFFFLQLFYVFYLNFHVSV